MNNSRSTAAGGLGDTSSAGATSTGRLSDYLSKLDHRVSLIVVEGSTGSSGSTAKGAATAATTTTTTVPEPRTPTHERGRASLAQRIQQLIAEEEQGGEQAQQQQLQEEGEGQGEQLAAPGGDGGFDHEAEQEEGVATAAVDAAAFGGVGNRRASFLPPNSGRPTLSSLLFPSLDSSAGAGDDRGEGEQQGGEGEPEGTTTTTTSTFAATAATTSPSPVAGGEGDGVSPTDDYEGGDGFGAGRRARLSLSPRAAGTLRRPSSPPLPRAMDGVGGEEQEGAAVGGQQQPQPRKETARRGTMMATGGGGNVATAAAAAVSKGELASVKSALRQDLEELHNMLLDVGKRVKEIETDVKQRGKLQAAKDTAQDELMEMEIKQLSRQLEAKLARTEIMDITQLQNQKMKAVESSVLGLMDEKAQRLQHKLHDELEKVLQQLYNIQQASDKTRRVVEERVKQSTTENLAVARELQKERRDKEELQGQVKRLADRVVQSEVKQAEESLKQREAARGLEERWQQQLAREAADARKEMKALGEAVGEDIGANVAAIRTERLELRAELLAALRDLDGRLATCREEFLRQASEAAAAQERSLESLNASLTFAMESRVAGVRAELLARVEALSQLQQASDAKTSVALQRQAERAGLQHEEALASIDATRREAAERLREKISGVEAAMQESHMQLSQRLSSTVQRLALCEVRGVEKHDLLKALLKEVAATLLKEEAAAGLEENAPLQEVVKRLEQQRTAETAAAARVDHLLVGIAESCKQMRGTVQALASRDNHGVVLETRLAEHCRGLVDQCVTVQVDPAASASSAALRMISAQRVMLRRETRDFIATNSYRIAKTIAAKADYEVIRLLVGRKDAMSDEECDATILHLRETYLHHFMQALAAGVEKKHPATSSSSNNSSASNYPASPAVAEARRHFYDKVEQAIRLALSKFSRVHVGHSLFGKIGLGGGDTAPPTCACCNRPFPHGGSSSSSSATAAAACAFHPPRPTAAAARAGPSGGAMRPTTSSALRPAISLELDASASSSAASARSKTRGKAWATAATASGPGPALRPTGLSRQATYSAVDEILKDFNVQGVRSGEKARASRR